MLDFFIVVRMPIDKNNKVEIFPKFIINNKSSDLMIRGGDFYAVWVEERGMWSTDEQDVIKIVDAEVKKAYFDEREKNPLADVHAKYMWDSDSGIVDKWHRYCQKQMRDSFHMLDEKLVFANDPVNKEDYASKRLPYPLEFGDISAWNKLIGTLYDPEEREKIEWAIGAIVSGDSRYIQKFLVLYGSAGTGKSTILNVIQQLFEGYYSVFDAKALGMANNAFALEAFKTNPLVAIQHDGDLSRIEDNTRLNSLVSHELMTVNEKFKSAYSNKFKSFLFMGTNKPVRITDAKSGLIRRLIDVTPSGNKLSQKDYTSTMKQVSFELGAIAKHCLEVYTDDPSKYDMYVPISMMGASNDFYNYILECFAVFQRDNGVTLKIAWEMYKKYCDDAKVGYPMSQRAFKEELKNYFTDFKERAVASDGTTRIRNYYSGFKADKFEEKPISKESTSLTSWLEMDSTVSIFDKECSDCPAQYANSKETPNYRWDNVKTKLGELDTTKLHYVKVPEQHVVIDFDIPGPDGKKNFELNLAEANKWPPTYAELSKGGQGIHLHYIYKGDVTKLSRLYADHIEVKIFNGGSSLRRKLSKCNKLPISVISSGLPLKKEDKVVNYDTVQSEKGLRTLIERNLRKEIHPGTKPSIDFIYKILQDAYDSGMQYDVSDTENAVLAFAMGSTHQSDYCMRMVTKMKFKSEEQSPVDSISSEQHYNVERPIVFYDVEVFPNLFLVNYKLQGKGKPVIRLINPTPEQIEELTQYRLIGFNCRRYDNHIMYGRLMGYKEIDLFRLSQKIITGDKDAFFGGAYDMSYTDVYDFASAGNKMSLKKWEIKLGIHHHELGLPWDQPVPEELWTKVAEYCDNDVLATEAVFDALSADWTARQILADLAGMNCNTTTNTLTTKIIFGDDRKPQSEFNYRNLAEPVHDIDEDTYEFLSEACPEMMATTHGPEGSLLPYFPGYKYEFGVSTYRDEEVGEGGEVYAEPGMYGNVALLDVSSMHPHSLIAEVLFGIRYTKAFRDIVEGRVSIKHESWDIVNGMLDGKLTPYIEKVKRGEMTSEDLANALKTAINSVYGLTAAKFDNAFKDDHNIDNIVAKRGALFMIDLKHAVQEKGFTVAHIKTDSIKIPDATPEIIQFVKDFGARYGYTFEHEATYDRMCLVNNAVYIAKYATVETCERLYGKSYVQDNHENCSKNKKKAGQWDATGKQFAVPYLFKTMFSHEDIEFNDMCETFQVQTALYLDLNESLEKLTAEEEHELEILDKAWHASEDKQEELMAKAMKRYSLDAEGLGARYHDLCEKEQATHKYQFVGKVGAFCPIKPGYGGGELLREGKDKNGNLKYFSATGANGYRWLEAETVKEVHGVDAIDRSFYDKLVDDAIKSLSIYGDYYWFVSDDPYIPPEYCDGKPIYPNELPFN